MPVHTTHQLPLTGERTVPGLSKENYWFRRHEAAYRWIGSQGFVSGTVVEAGCGEGYGAAILRSTADQVLAIDYDAVVIDHVRRSYPQVQTLRANLVDLPVRTGTVDVVVSLQVVEHLWDLASFLGECHRILRPGGRVVVSTPNRITFSPGLGRGQRPTNPFHVEEFDADQLLDLLAAAGFSMPLPRILGLRHGPRLRAEETGSGSLVERQIAAVMSDDWSPGLMSTVASVTCQDFEIGAVDRQGDLDLMAVARR